MLSILIHSLKEETGIPDSLLYMAFFGAMDGSVDHSLKKNGMGSVKIDLSALSHAKEADDNGG